MTVVAWWIMVFVDMANQIPFASVVLGVVGWVTDVAYEAQMSARITDCKPQVYRTHRPRCRLNDTTGASEWLRLYVAPPFANLST
jgi:hypothetical protein